MEANDDTYCWLSKYNAQRWNRARLLVFENSGGDAEKTIPTQLSIYRHGPPKFAGDDYTGGTGRIREISPSENAYVSGIKIVATAES